MAHSPMAAQGSTVRAVPGIVLYELKSCQNMHLSTLPSCLFVLPLMARIPWVCSFGISVSLYTEQRPDKIKPYVCRLPDSRWKEENAMFDVFPETQMWFFSSCYRLTEEHIPYWANVLPFRSHWDDLLVLINSRSGGWQRIIRMIALISGCAQSRDAQF